VKSAMARGHGTRPLCLAPNSQKLRSPSQNFEKEIFAHGGRYAFTKQSVSIVFSRVVSKRMTDEMKEYAMNFVLLGVALARDGDGDFVRKHLSPDLLMGTLQHRGLQSVQTKNRDMMRSFLAEIGVDLCPEESAVDAILRTHVDIATVRLHAQQTALKLIPARRTEAVAAKEKSK